MSNSTNTPTTEPSMLNAHVQYAKGAVEELVGVEGGKSVKEDAVCEMRAAQKPVDIAETEAKEPNTLLGSVEAGLGKLVGCEGMEQEGNASKASAETKTTGSDRVV